MTAAVHKLPVFRNEHLSVSRLKKFEQCALSFYFQYVDKSLDKAPRGDRADFGNVLHDALERTYRWIVEEEYEGAFPEARLLDFYREAWAESGLVGVELFQEGRQMLVGYARDTERVDHMSILSVEKEFNLLLGPGICRLIDASEKPKWKMVDDHFVVNGFMDRVMRVEDDIEVADYKSGYMLFTREELDTDLQMSIYAIVAKLMYPWAKGVRMAFHMLRHRTRQTVRRTEADLQTAIDYVLALGVRSERGPYEAKINTFCGTCDHRNRCDAYKQALEKKFEAVRFEKSDLDALGRERERAAQIAKAAYARKATLDDIIKTMLKDRESVELAGTIYRLDQYFDTSYPPDVLKLFPPSVDTSKLLIVDKKAVDELVDRLEKDESIPRTVRDFLRVRVAAKSVKVPQAPRINSRGKKK